MANWWLRPQPATAPPGRPSSRASLRSSGRSRDPSGFPRQRQATSRRRHGCDWSRISTESTIPSGSAHGWRRPHDANRFGPSACRTASWQPRTNGSSIRHPTTQSTGVFLPKSAIEPCGGRSRRSGSAVRRFCACSLPRPAELPRGQFGAGHAHRSDRPDSSPVPRETPPEPKTPGHRDQLTIVTMHEDDPQEHVAEALRSLFARIDPMPASVTESGKASYAWRRIDAELAELLADSAIDAESLALARGRRRTRAVRQFRHRQTSHRLGDPSRSAGTDNPRSALTALQRTHRDPPHRPPTTDQ